MIHYAPSPGASGGGHKPPNYHPSPVISSHEFPFRQAEDARLSRQDFLMMPVSALCKLVGVVPDELLSQLLDPVGKHIADNGSGDENLDALGEDADAVATEVRRARHPDSPAGTNIHPIERQAILGKARKLRAA